MAKVKLASPWVRFYREVNALFADDPQIDVAFDEEAYEVKLYVDNIIKADAIAQLLPTEKVFGNVTVKITVIPANTEPSKESLFKAAFDGNPVLEDVETVSGPFTASYVIFNNEVVQYVSDNMNSIYGITSTLYEDIAKNVFGDTPGVFFCTKANFKVVE